MPFVAKNKNTGERIDITQIVNPRVVLKKGTLVCPLCNEDLFIVAGLVRVHHFRHRIKCSSEWLHHPESIEHLTAKSIIANYLRSRKDYKGRGVNIELEVPLEEINRQADILVTFPTGWRVVHEVQLSSITIEELQQRTFDYERLDIQTYWWLGKNAASETNIDWCEMAGIGCIEIEFSRRVVSKQILDK